MPKHVFITGVSTGLGHGLAQHYLRQGETVYGCSRREPEGFEEFDSFRFQSCDLADFDSVPDQLAKLFQNVEACDLAILNAGILSPFGDVRDVSMEDCRRVMDVNVWSNKAILDWLIPRFPSLKQVATISSGAAVNGNRGWNAYSISKAALNMLTKLYAAENPDRHFVAVAPGLIETHMQDVLCAIPADERFSTLETLKARQGTPEMPSPRQLAPRLCQVINDAPHKINSGEFIDIRKIDW